LANAAGRPCDGGPNDGRHRGRPLNELPDDYVEWLRGLDDLREPLRRAVEAEWRRWLDAETAQTRGGLLPLEAVPIADELVTAGLRVLTRRHHPDVGGDHRTMCLITVAATWLRVSVRGAV
jgi:hypothetical protein